MNRRQFLQKGVLGLAGIVGIATGCFYDHQQEFEFNQLMEARKNKEGARAWMGRNQTILYVSDPEGIEKIEVYDDNHSLVHISNFKKSVFPVTEKILKLDSQYSLAEVKIYGLKGNIKTTRPSHWFHY
ncbi:MAG: hypothetical protein AABX29_02350 [Nanoarchaeota archaeon]